MPTQLDIPNLNVLVTNDLETKRVIIRQPATIVGFSSIPLDISSVESASYAETASLALYALFAEYTPSASFATTASAIIGGTATYLPIWNTDTTLSSSAVYETVSDVVINKPAIILNGLTVNDAFVSGTVYFPSGSSIVTNLYAHGAIDIIAGPTGYASLNSYNSQSAVVVDDFGTEITGSLGVSGVSTFNNNQLISGSVFFEGNDVVLSPTNIQSPTILSKKFLEYNNIRNVAITGSIDFDTMNHSLIYYTVAASGDWTVNFRGNNTTSLNDSMEIGQNITVALMITNSSPAYYAVGHSIDGVSVVPYWQGSAPTGGDENAMEVYSYSIVKTADATFTIIAAKVRFS